MKVALNGFKIGERLLKVVFDNAMKQRVDEIYVTIFEKRPEQLRLIHLLESFGFQYYGVKSSRSGEEKVYVRSLQPQFDIDKPRSTYPFFHVRTIFGLYQFIQNIIQNFFQIQF